MLHFLTVALVILKALEMIDLSWWWCVTPSIIALAMWFVAVGLVLTAAWFTRS